MMMACVTLSSLGSCSTSLPPSACRGCACSILDKIYNIKVTPQLRKSCRIMVGFCGRGVQLLLVVGDAGRTAAAAASFSDDSNGGDDDDDGDDVGVVV